MKHIIKSVSIILLLIVSVGLYGQSITMRIANKRFRDMRYASAIPLYEDVLKRKPSNREARIKLAESYRKIKDVKNAERVYAVLAHEEGVSAENIKHYADMLAEDKKYDEALNWYNTYSILVPQDESVIAIRSAYQNMESFYKDSAEYRVKYVPSLNSWQSDFSPVFYKDGLVFCSNRKFKEIVKSVFDYDQSSFIDLYFANDTSSLKTELTREVAPVIYTVSTNKDANNSYTPATSNDSNTPGNYGKTFLYDSIRYNFTPDTQIELLNKTINTKYHDGPVTFFKGQDSVIFTRSTKSSGGVTRLQLYEAEIKNGGWVNERKLPFNSLDYSISHPSFTADNKKLFFASDMPGGAGGTDIYFVEYDNGVWSKPVNISAINTTGNEMFPYTDPMGTFYFASDGHPGLGGLDIFTADLSQYAVVVKNVGFPINSSYDDFGMIWDESMRKGFFSSNRKRGFADDDIYSFEKVCEEVSVYVYDVETKLPIESAAISANGVPQLTDKNGKMQICLVPGEYPFTASKANYEGFNVITRQHRIEMPLSPVHFNMAGTIFSEEDKSPMEGVAVKLLNDKHVTIAETTTTKDGKYQFPLDLNSTYRIEAAKESCGTNFTEKSTVGLLASQTLLGDMGLLCKGDIIRVENIYYDLNKYNIRPDAEIELDKMAEVMWKYPDMRIELRSHTDSRSSKTFNMKLSTNRAEAVVQYLATKGIVPSRMRAAGYGESVPVNKCVDGVTCTEEEYQQNRRTEFKVLSIK